MYSYLKRIIDIIGAFIGIIVLSPLFIIVTIGLHFANQETGAFFTQERPGRNGKLFKLIKYKTMTDQRDADGELLPDADRLTTVGRMVRSFSIDELPQLFNVLKGDMSFIGPRPLLAHYLPWYTPEQARRHEVRPGITGWAQVNGRNHCKLSKKFEYDVYYVDHCSLKLDCKIIWMTINNVLHRKDVGEGTGNMAEVDDLGFHERYLQLVAERKKNKIMEFGSDFHSIDYPRRTGSNDHLYQLRNYATGRHAIEAVLRHEQIKRVWIPTYFCYEVIQYLENVGFTIVLYPDNPLKTDDDDRVRQLPFQKGDALLRMNYFGLRSKRTNKGITVPVIEDHSHGISTEWAKQSDADWCIASIRKTLPTPAGGIVWSPVGKQLPPQFPPDDSCIKMAVCRFQAMQMKRDYLNGVPVEKEMFRTQYIQSEEMLEQLDLTGMDKYSKQILEEIDIEKWDSEKQRNIRYCKQLLRKEFQILYGETAGTKTFSLLLLTPSAEERTQLRQHLIANKIYPAVLWNIPTSVNDKEAFDISTRIISIHCDGRYNSLDIQTMCNIINCFYD